MVKGKKKTSVIDIEFAFYEYLVKFYKENRTTIRKKYQLETRRFLDFNNPENKGAFLRTPQFEALEMYIFIKEYCDNRPLHEIFNNWFHKRDGFESRSEIGVRTLFGSLNEEIYQQVFEHIKSSSQNYANYIYALTMGTGKTILMATCIFYEFILANKYPDDPHYCHNALVFAPDKTVLQSLKEIKTFDKSRVVPKQYVNWLDTNLQFHFLEDTASALSIINRSRFNIVISNTQKIILKKQHKEKAVSEKFFASDSPAYTPGSVYEKYKDLYDLEDEGDLLPNQRFHKLTRIEQLGVYVDEAHHAFGNTLAGDLTSLRTTIMELDDKLRKAGTHIVACYNYTGTPYVGNQVLPEVVYAYSLHDAIKNKYLKQVVVNSFERTKDLTFVREALTDFWKNHKGKRYEDMLPKIAFFASTIDELENDLRPRVEKVMEELRIAQKRLLVNVGDEKLTTSDDIREFNLLDTPESEKQIILLVNKGKEGWNCRSLFSVALFREPHSKIFVLQATMRAMRSITDIQETARIYLTEECRRILANELEANFRIDIDEFQSIGKDKKPYQVRTVPPPIIIPLKRVRNLFEMKEKEAYGKIDFGLKQLDLEKYKSYKNISRLTNIRQINTTEDISARDDKREFSMLTLVGEIARYLHRPCLEIEKLQFGSKDGVELILERVNQFNEILYEVIIPSIFNFLYEISTYKKEEPSEVYLVHEPAEGYYTVQAKPEMVAAYDDATYSKHVKKSFHLNYYCFDSTPEKTYFEKQLFENNDVKKVWFTGMFKHGQTEFYIPYIDPESHTLRSYYPDFLLQKTDDSFDLVEIKGDHKVDDPVVQAKREVAEQVAYTNQMKYIMLRSSDLEKVSVAKKEKGFFLDFVTDYVSRMFKDLLPVYTLQAACGKFGNGQDVECEGWVEVKDRKLDQGMFIVQAVGKSMEPDIPENSYCIFRFNPAGSRQNKIVLVQHQGTGDPETGGEYTIKKYTSEKIYEKDGTWKHFKITLSPLNPEYEPMVFEGKGEDFENEFNVIGEFLEVYK